MSTQKTGGLLAALGNKKEKAAVQQLEANETTAADKKAIQVSTAQPRFEETKKEALPASRIAPCKV